MKWNERQDLADHAAVPTQYKDVSISMPLIQLFQWKTLQSQVGSGVDAHRS
jgi:hypothetical protein